MSILSVVVASCAFVLSWVLLFVVRIHVACVILFLLFSLSLFSFGGVFILFLFRFITCMHLFSISSSK